MLSLFHHMPPIKCRDFEERVKYGQSIGKNVMWKLQPGEVRGMFPIKRTKCCPRVPRRCGEELIHVRKAL